MKALIGTLCLVLALFSNSVGGHQQELSPIRTFQYRPAIHIYLSDLMRKVNGQTIVFNAFTTLVARGATLFGWLNHRNVIEPIFMRNVLVTYNLDEEVPSVTTMAQLTAYGVYEALPVGPWPLDPIRTFLYRPAIHAYFAHLKKMVDAQQVQFDEHTILVARGAHLFGWLNTENVIEPIFLRRHPVMYNLDEHMPTMSNLEQLMSYGLFVTLPVGPSNLAQSRSRSRSTSRSPKNRHSYDSDSSSRSRSRSPLSWERYDAQSSARSRSP